MEKLRWDKVKRMLYLHDGLRFFSSEANRYFVPELVTDFVGSACFPLEGLKDLNMTRTREDIILVVKDPKSTHIRGFLKDAMIPSASVGEEDAELELRGTIIMFKKAIPVPRGFIKKKDRTKMVILNEEEKDKIAAWMSLGGVYE
jgi:hypothetical protein